ncbi:hypothetical protein PIB30_037709 [Stylosanthes scabra]|uniref:Uncharacterized protein n=1 Tax=Stylosanthes scabra TaxID=79078 RepID=A0ABU6ZCE9_9FABA|nr:hypothetical protein [Stylosanthes scabra]
MHHRANIAGKVVLNVGCGTGFLALFWAQAGARKLNPAETDNSTLLRNRREIQLKNMLREIAKLLDTGKGNARIKVEHIIIKENMMAAQEIIELFCELIVV